MDGSTARRQGNGGPGLAEALHRQVQHGSFVAVSLKETVSPCTARGQGRVHACVAVATTMTTDHRSDWLIYVLRASWIVANTPAALRSFCAYSRSGSESSWRPAPALLTFGSGAHSTMRYLCLLPAWVGYIHEYTGRPARRREGGLTGSVQREERGGGGATISAEQAVNGSGREGRTLLAVYAHAETVPRAPCG